MMADQKASVTKRVAELGERKVETEAIRAETKAMRDKSMEDNMNAWREETMVYQEQRKACLECKEPTSEDTEAVDREVPKEVTVRSSGALRKRRRSRYIAAVRRGQPEKGPGEILDPGRNWSSRQKDDPPCKSGIAQERRRQKVLDQVQG
jgi:hypothetical protein